MRASVDVGTDEVQPHHVVEEDALVVWRPLDVAETQPPKDQNRAAVLDRRMAGACHAPRHIARGVAVARTRQGMPPLRSDVQNVRPLVER